MISISNRFEVRTWQQVKYGKIWKGCPLKRSCDREIGSLWKRFSVELSVYGPLGVKTQLNHFGFCSGLRGYPVGAMISFKISKIPNPYNSDFRLAENWGSWNSLEKLLYDRKYLIIVMLWLGGRFKKIFYNFKSCRNPNTIFGRRVQKQRFLVKNSLLKCSNMLNMQVLTRNRLFSLENWLLFSWKRENFEFLPLIHSHSECYHRSVLYMLYSTHIYGVPTHLKKINTRLSFKSFKFFENSFNSWMARKFWSGSKLMQQKIFKDFNPLRILIILSFAWSLTLGCILKLVRSARIFNSFQLRTGSKLKFSEIFDFSEFWKILIHQNIEVKILILFKDELTK